MTDLFAPKLKRNAGYGNGTYLADLANGLPMPVIRERFKAGEYPDLNLKASPEWARLAGRISRGTK